MLKSTVLKQKLSFASPRYWLTWLGLAILRLVCLFPYSVQMAFGKKLGSIAYYLSPSRRHITRVNLSLCFPKYSPNEINTLVRKTYHSLGMGIIEMAMAWWLKPTRLKNLLQVSGAEHIATAQQQNRGILLIGAHFSTLDLVGRLLAQKFPISATYRQSKNKLVNYIMEKKRNSYFHHSIERHQIRPFIRALQNQEMIWYAPDQDYGRKVSIFAPFFGVQAATITATAKLARITKAVLIPMHQFRLANNQGYKVEFGPPIDNFPSDNSLENATRINKNIEDAILKCPDQYIWQHRRFKTQPEGVSRPY